MFFFIKKIQAEAEGARAHLNAEGIFVATVFPGKLARGYINTDFVVHRRVDEGDIAVVRRPRQGDSVSRAGREVPYQVPRVALEHGHEIATLRPLQHCGKGPIVRKCQPLRRAEFWEFDIEHAGADERPDGQPELEFGGRNNVAAVGRPHGRLQACFFARGERIRISRGGGGCQRAAGPHPQRPHRCGSSSSGPPATRPSAASRVSEGPREPPRPAAPARPRASP